MRKCICWIPIASSLDNRLFVYIFKFAFAINHKYTNLDFWALMWNIGLRMCKIFDYWSSVFCISSFALTKRCPSPSCHWSPERDGVELAYLIDRGVSTVYPLSVQWVCLSGCLHCCRCYLSLIMLPYVAVSVHRNQYTCYRQWVWVDSARKRSVSL